MAITIDDFNKIWASTSPLTPYSFSESNYKEGWNFIGATPPSRQMWDSWLKMTDEKCQYLYNHEDVPVGHEYFTFNPNIPQGSLPLFGGEYSRETYSALWNWVQEQTGYLKTEAEWQTLATANNGNVPYYSDGDGSTTFRVPALNCWMRSANGTVSEVGSYLQAGLPNITGKLITRATNYNASTIISAASGVFSVGGDDTSQQDPVTQSSGQVNRKTVNFSASNSSSIYGNSNTVQPSSVVGMWLVKAYGTVADTGVINEQQYIDDRLATKLNVTGGNIIGSLSVGGVEVVTNQVTELTDLSATSFSKCSIVAFRGWRFGKVVFLFLNLQATEQINVGSECSFTVVGVPAPCANVYSASYSSSTCIVGLLRNTKSFTGRVTGANLPNNYTFGISFTYLTNE